MLNREEEIRLASCLRTIHGYQMGEVDLLLSPGTIEWLAVKLQEVNNDLKEITKDLEQKSATEAVAVIPSPLTIETEEGLRVVAIWETDKYVCVFCQVWRTDMEEALTHGREHLKKHKKCSGDPWHPAGADTI